MKYSLYVFIILITIFEFDVFAQSSDGNQEKKLLDEQKEEPSKVETKLEKRESQNNLISINSQPLILKKRQVRVFRNNEPFGLLLPFKRPYRLKALSDSDLSPAIFSDKRNIPPLNLDDRMADYIYRNNLIKGNNKDSKNLRDAVRYLREVNELNYNGNYQNQLDDLLSGTDSSQDNAKPIKRDDMVVDESIDKKSVENPKTFEQIDGWIGKEDTVKKRDTMEAKMDYADNDHKRDTKQQGANLLGDSQNPIDFNNNESWERGIRDDIAALKELVKRQIQAKGKELSEKNEVEDDDDEEAQRKRRHSMNLLDSETDVLNPLLNNDETMKVLIRKRRYVDGDEQQTTMFSTRKNTGSAIKLVKPYPKLGFSNNFTLITSK